MTRRATAFGERDAQRVAAFVRGMEREPKGRARRRGWQPTAPVVRTVFVTSTTPDGFLHPGQIQEYDVANGTWPAVGDCLVRGANDELLLIQQYRGLLVGETAGTPIFAVACCQLETVIGSGSGGSGGGQPTCLQNMNLGAGLPPTVYAHITRMDVATGPFGVPPPGTPSCYVGLTVTLNYVNSPITLLGPSGITYPDYYEGFFDHCGGTYPPPNCSRPTVHRMIMICACAYDDCRGLFLFIDPDLYEIDCGVTYELGGACATWGCTTSPLAVDFVIPSNGYLQWPPGSSIFITVNETP